MDLIKFSNSFIDDDGNFRKENLFPDKLVANVFCEPSTRTKSSFAIAARNLGCSILDFNIDNSSVQKGESIFETIDALNLMGVNLCVIRHPDSVIRELAEFNTIGLTASASAPEEQLNLFIDQIKKVYAIEVLNFKEDENITFKIPNFLN